MSPKPDPGHGALPDALLDAFARTWSTRSYPAQVVLIHEGDEGDSMFIVHSGRVKVYASGDAGRELVLDELGRGQCFGELSLDGARRSVSVKTTQATTCTVISGANLAQAIEHYPVLATHVTMRMIRMVRRLTEQVKRLVLQDVYGRVVGLLMELSDPVADTRVLRQRLTQQDIADRVGSSREMVHRVMKALTIGGYVSADSATRLLVIRKRLPQAW